MYIRQNEESLMDVEHAEMVAKQLDAMIQRRARKGDVDPDEPRGASGEIVEHATRRSSIDMAGNSINSRLRRLEEREGRASCPECSGAEGLVFVYDEATERKALDERCSRCGGALTIIRVVFDGNEEGGRGKL